MSEIAASHTQAAGHLRQALICLRRAHQAEDGLEWSGALAEMIREGQHIEQRLRDYAQLAEAPWQPSVRVAD